MFDDLSSRLDNALKKLRGQGKLTEKNIEASLKDVRMALLEADVHYRVAKQFVADVKEAALGQEVLESLTPGQQIVKIVNDKLTELMGGHNEGLNLVGQNPAIIMMVGLQGSGKTTTTGKLALALRKQGKKPYLAPVDIYRPAAIDQLQKLGAQIDVPVYATDPKMDPVQICLNARADAIAKGCDTVLLDTAGRLHIDDELMVELERLKKAMVPREILLVVDAMTGQDAVNMAKSFDERLAVTGLVLTKLDGDARGGAALSIKSITGRPVKYVGLGEKLSAFEPFHPDRMASRILGMGDVLSLIEKAQETVDQKRAAELEKKLRKNQFTLDDFKDQLQQIKKLGSIGDILGMLPGMGKIKAATKKMQVDDGELGKIEAIINSMTAKERRDYTIINGSRRKRIATGSGTSVQQVNNLLKNYQQMLKMLKKMNRGSAKSAMRNMKNLLPR